MDSVWAATPILERSRLDGRVARGEAGAAVFMTGHDLVVDGGYSLW